MSKSKSNKKKKIDDFFKKIDLVENTYSQIIDNINQLCDDFLFDDVISIASLLEYMIVSGYLSEDMIIDDENYECLGGTSGIGVINGHAICRHYSAMLVDVLKSRGIECEIMYGVMDDAPSILAKNDPDKPMSLMEKYSYVYDHIYYYDEISDICDSMKENNDYFNNVEVSYDVCDKLVDHAVVICKQDGICYIIDLFNGTVFKPLDGDTSIVIDDMMVGLSTDNRVYNDENVSKMLKLPMSLRESDNDRKEEAMDIILSGKVFIEEFYKNNNSLYRIVNENSKTYSKKYNR